MPVPVPHHSKQPAHLVIKQHCSDDGVNHSFQDLTGILPVSPTGPPPSFGTREQWINSLPSWRRSKPRRIWEDDSHPFAEQDFHTGLAAADNASAIKGSRAKACPPPFYIQPGTIAPTIKGPATSIEMVPHGPFDTAGMHANDKACSIATNMEIDVYDYQDRGAFTPIFEDDSPEFRSSHEVSSSPIEPVTPFGDFVDRAVSSTSAVLSCSYVSNASLAGAADDTCQLQCYRSHPAAQPFIDLAVSVPAPELVTPTATSGYRKLSEPLSEWIANFVWKACTTGTNIPSSIAKPRSVSAYAVAPPSYFATSIHSLLLSTLLQPSAIFLALWYIVRLPVSFGTVSMSADRTKELRFRMVLLGENHVLNQDVTDNTAPFRLIVLGCMLANKWLDDHTFSNKTWHSISNVPIKILNELESLALDIFAYDLSISTADWSDWLLHIMSYHLSMSSPSHPQPISRPSANPHLIIKFALEEIVNAPKACDSDLPQRRPVFLGLEERRREKQEKEQAQKANVLEIDLDEDGPLREEYMPKRRVSEAGAPHSVENSFTTQRQIWDTNKSAEKLLPPPARWSPAGDEPILRDSNRPHGRYLAVQPTPGVLVPVTSYQGLPQYQSTHEFNYHPAHPVFNPCPPPLLFPFALPHSRSQSYSHDQDTSQSYNHTRSYSQSQFEYMCCDLRMTPNELPPVQADVDMTWGSSGRHSYGPPAFAPHPSATYQSTWLRT
ncbi:hypothetical protein EV368DRAFT_31402 [Lentinula lateritia]|nr:hypothetical protein EV368DRAFT_31402 [Lentinula lateritia]